MSVLITSKGQATIPKDVREHLGVEPGSRIDFIKHPNGSVHILPVLPLDPNRGVVKYTGRAATIEEMNEAIGEAVPDRNRRTRQK